MKNNSSNIKKRNNNPEENLEIFPLLLEKNDSKPSINHIYVAKNFENEKLSTFSVQRSTRILVRITIFELRERLSNRYIIFILYYFKEPYLKKEK